MIDLPPRNSRHAETGYCGSKGPAHHRPAVTTRQKRIHGDFSRFKQETVDRLAPVRRTG